MSPHEGIEVKEEKLGPVALFLSSCCLNPDIELSANSPVPCLPVCHAFCPDDKKLNSETVKKPQLMAFLYNNCHGHSDFTEIEQSPRE